MADGTRIPAPVPERQGGETSLRPAILPLIDALARYAEAKEHRKREAEKRETTA